MFQFQYGTIKSPFAEETDIFLNRFNSSMVRLKGYCLHFSRVSRRFQFQYGTIKSARGEWYAKMIQKFQFQYGTIKSSFEAHRISPLPHFNSSMVRLKVDRLNINYHLFIDFNSSMVRLKAKSTNWIGGHTTFQFQYGTIKRDVFCCFV